MAYLTKEQVRQIIAKRPPGTTPEGIVSALRETHRLEGYDSLAAASSGPGELRVTPSMGQMALNQGVAQLPTIMGITGGLLGAPMGPAGSVGMAALGGIIGNRGRAFLTHQPPPKNIAAGAEQGLYEMGGLALGGMANRMGAPLIRKTVRFQRAERPSVILNEFGKPFMVEGAQVEFQKQAPKGAKHAADIAMDVASHAMGPGGALARPLMRGVRGKAARGASAFGSWMTGPRFQIFARQFPRAAQALYQLMATEEPDATAVQP